MLIVYIMNPKENTNTPKVDAFPPYGVNDKPSTVGVYYSSIMNEICGIYKITSPSKKIYIGQSGDIRKRFTYYKALSCKGQTCLYHSFLKYGVDKHKFEIIHVCDPFQLNELEKYYVDLFQCFNQKYGLNLRDGGGSSGRHSDETRTKIGLKSKGRKHSEETKHKIMLALKGKKKSQTHTDNIGKAKIGNKYWLGKRHSEETLEKLRNKKFSDETRRKISIAAKNRNLERLMK